MRIYLNTERITKRGQPGLSGGGKVERIKCLADGSGVTPRAATILGRTGAAPGDAARNAAAQVGLFQRLDTNVMFPPISEIIDIGKALTAPQPEVAEADARVAASLRTIIATVQVKAPEILVFASHRRLNGDVQPEQTYRGRHDDASPSGRLYVFLTDGAVFAFLTCEPNPLVADIHPKAMPVVLHEDDYDRWLTCDYDGAVKLAVPYPSQLMTVGRHIPSTGPGETEVEEVPGTGLLDVIAD